MSVARSVSGREASVLGVGCSKVPASSAKQCVCVAPLQGDRDLLRVIGGPAVRRPGVRRVLRQLVLHDGLELREKILNPGSPGPITGKRYLLDLRARDRLESLSRTGHEGKRGGELSLKGVYSKINTTINHQKLD